jgi:hypothetical protein
VQIQQALQPLSLEALAPLANDSTSPADLARHGRQAHPRGEQQDRLRPNYCSMRCDQRAVQSLQLLLLYVGQLDSKVGLPHARPSTTTHREWKSFRLLRVTGSSRLDTFLRGAVLSGRDATAGGVLKSCRETCDG